jgi:hypothetical protein
VRNPLTLKLTMLILMVTNKRLFFCLIFLDGEMPKIFVAKCKQGENKGKWYAYTFSKKGKRTFLTWCLEDSAGTQTKRVKYAKDLVAAMNKKADKIDGLLDDSSDNKQ